MMSYASADPSRLIPFGSVHPGFTDDVGGGNRARIIEMGARALKVHPPHQIFRANAYLHELPALAELYRAREAAGIPVTIHTGTSVFPGARSRLGDPMDVDDVAIDFPKLKILLAHGGRPLWMEAAFFVVRRHPNVFLEVSGIPPAKLLEYFPRLEEIADKTVWGTDWPSPGIKSMRQNVGRRSSRCRSARARRRRQHPAIGERGENLVMTADLLAWRKEFPIVDTCTYLVSHSLGAMPRKTARLPAAVRRRVVERAACARGTRAGGRSAGDRRSAGADSRRRAGHDLDAPERHGRAWRSSRRASPSTARAARS